jgi:2-oxoglutarate dehydrogenase E1 component
MIAEEFGANATYVQGLLERFRNNPELVDDSWRAYFNELLSDGPVAAQTSGNGAKATAINTEVDAPTPTKQARAAPAPAPESKPVSSQSVSPDAEVTAIRGPALKIVENMETSLSVPTATSERRIPVKLLDENRRIINKHLAENDRGKASYTHIIAWAILRALDEFPQLNDGFADVDGVASRVSAVKSTSELQSIW